jgi:hypothetical protein
MLVKTSLKLLGGIVALVVGAAGVTLSCSLIFQIRKTSDRLEREIPQNLAHVEEIAHSVRTQGEATSQVLQSTRVRVSFLGESIARLSDKLNDRDNASSLLMVIDEDIDAQLDNAKQFVLSMQQSMRNMGSTLQLFDSVSLLGHEGFSPSSQGDSVRHQNPLRTVAVGLTQTADLLDQVTQAINRLQSGESISPFQLSQIQFTLNQVDRELLRIKSEVTRFSKEVAQTEAKFTHLKTRSPVWVRYVSNMISLFLFCFGFAQLLVAVYGLRWIKEARNSGSQTLLEPAP